MHFLALNILATVAFLTVFRTFPRFRVDNFQAIVFNYLVCTLLGLLFVPAEVLASEFSFRAPWLPFALLLGLLFISIFYLVALTAQRVSLAVASVASKMSLIIPTLVSLYLLKTGKDFNVYNAVGMGMALVSVVLSAWNEKSPNPDTKGTSPFLLLFLPLAVFIGSGLVDTLINVTNRLYLTEKNQTLLPVGIFSIAFAIGSVLLLLQLALGRARLSWRNVLGGIALGLPNYFSIFFLVKSLTYFENDGTLVFPVSNIGVILMSTLLGIALFREKLSKINLAGVACAVLAIALLSLKFG